MYGTMYRTPGREGGGGIIGGIEVVGLGESNHIGYFLPR